jgi:hypothetical protein
LAIIGTPLLAATEPMQSGQVAAIFPIGWSQAKVLIATSRANLSLIRLGSFDNIGIIDLEHADAVNALRRQGAILILPSNALGGCLQGWPRQSPADFSTNRTST